MAGDEHPTYGFMIDITSLPGWPQKLFFIVCKNVLKRVVLSMHACIFSLDTTS